MASVDVMQKVNNILKEQVDSVNITSNKFLQIEKAMKKSEEAVSKLNVSGKEMNLNKDDLLEMIESLSAISGENAAGVQESTASIEEQTASIEEIANLGKNLSQYAEKLERLVEKFKIKN